MTAALSLAPERHDDFFVAASENYPAVLDSPDSDLINLGTDLQPKLLAFRHRFAVDDGVPRGAVERNGGDDERTGRNFALVGSARRNFSGRFPAYRPKWTSRSGVDTE